MTDGHAVALIGALCCWPEGRGIVSVEVIEFFSLPNIAMVASGLVRPLLGFSSASSR
jgi:hypothetical protein